MSTWDVFQSELMQARRGMTSDEVAAALAAGELREDDLVRPAGGAAPWTRLGDEPLILAALAARLAALRAAAPPPQSPAPTAQPSEPDAAGFALVENPQAPPPPNAPSADAPTRPSSNLPEGFPPPKPAPIAPPPPVVVPPLLPADDEPESESEPDDEPQSQEPENLDLDAEFEHDEDAEAGEFSLARPGVERVEELDLAAMVDVALQLVLFFLVTASTIVYKALAIPNPTPEPPPDAVAQQQIRTLDDLQREFILVDVSDSGEIRVNQEPVEPTMDAVAARLREVRAETGMTTMLLNAAARSRHRNTVLALDAAQDVGMEISIGRAVDEYD